MFFTNVMAETEKSLDFAHGYIIVSFVVAQRLIFDKHIRKSAADFMIGISISSSNIITS